MNEGGEKSEISPHWLHLMHRLKQAHMFVFTQTVVLSCMNILIRHSRRFGIQEENTFSGLSTLMAFPYCRWIVCYSGTKKLNVCVCKKFIVI